MTFTARKRELLKNRKGKAASTFFLALIIAAAFFIPYILTDNGYFIFYGDFNVQQIPFYKLCHQAVKSGELAWSFTTDLGSNFIGSYSFYLLGSPFFWLTIPFSTDFVPYLMGPLLILKFACAALTAYLYLNRFTRKASSAQIGAILYAFSGFSIYNIFFNHFHEAIIVFPLLLLSLELLLTENRRGVFAFMVAVCAVTNYFFFVGMVVFCIIYWFIKIISGAVKFSFGRLCTIAFESVIGVLLSAFILLPSILMVAGNGRVSEFQTGWNAILYGNEQIYLNVIECFFFPPDVPSRPVFFPGAGVKWASLGGWLPVIGMTAVLGFVSSKKGHWITRVLTVCAFMAMVPVLNSMFYALNGSYYARWYYMPILIMCLATAITFEDYTVDWMRGWRNSAIITAAIALVVGLFPQKVDGKIVLGLYTNAGNDNKFYLFRFLCATAIAVLGILLTLILVSLHKRKKKGFYFAALSVICAVSVLYSGIFIYQGKMHSDEIQGVMIDQLIEGEVHLPDLEKRVYRIDTYGGIDNTGMYLDLPTINAFHSVVSPSIMDFYDFIDVQRDVASRPSTKYHSIRNLLSVRYLLNRENGESFTNEYDETKMPGYSFVTIDGGYRIYENENYIPYGFSYDYYISKSECELLYKGVTRADIMLKAIVLEDEFAKTYVGSMKHYSDYADKEDTTIKDPLTNDDTSSDDSSVGSENLPSDGFVSATEESVWGLTTSTDYETLSRDAAELKKSSAEFFSIGNGTFSATVTRDTDDLVFFSIPYDKGWSATVNGQETEIIKANIGFMAVAVNEGTSEIVFTYTTPGLVLGLSVSVVAAAVLVLYLIISFFYKRGNRKEESYIEGEELLNTWSQAQTEELVLNSVEDIKFDYLDTDESDLGEQKYTSGFKIDLSEFNDKKGVDKD